MFSINADKCSRTILRSTRRIISSFSFHDYPYYLVHNKSSSEFYGKFFGNYKAFRGNSMVIMIPQSGKGSKHTPTHHTPCPLQDKFEKNPTIPYLVFKNEIISYPMCKKSLLLFWYPPQLLQSKKEKGLQ